MVLEKQEVSIFLFWCTRMQESCLHEVIFNKWLLLCSYYFYDARTIFLSLHGCKTAAQQKEKRKLNGSNEMIFNSFILRDVYSPRESRRLWRPPLIYTICSLALLQKIPTDTQVVRSKIRELFPVVSLQPISQANEVIRHRFFFRGTKCQMQISFFLFQTNL